MRSTIKFLLLAAVFSMYACHNDDNPEPADNSTGTLFLHLHTYLENNEVDAYNITYTTDLGRKVMLSLAQLYLSHIQLVKADGSIYNVPDKKILKVLETNSYSLGEVPVGDYKSIRFHVGFDATDNQADPSSDAALLNHPEMWFGASPQPDGYVFLHVKGMIDTTAEAIGTNLQPFEYKLGTSANYVEVSFPEKTLTVEKDNAVYEHIVVDYYRLFNGINLSKAGNLSVLTAADNAVSPATQLTNNLTGLFRYEDE